MITISISPDDREAIVHEIARTLAYGDGHSDDECNPRGGLHGSVISKEVNARVREIISSEAVKALDEEVRKVARTEVDKLLAEGVAERDHYGRTTGTKSLADLVKLRLFGDGNYNKGLVVESLNKALEAAFDGEVKQLVAQAKERLRAAFDAQVTAKIAAVIREAVGLK